MRPKRPSARTLAQLTDAVPHLFYALMALAFLAVVFGSPGFGLLLLIIGACAHVARVGIEAVAGTGVERSVRVPEAINGEIEVKRTRPWPRREPARAAAGAERRASRPERAEPPERVARPRAPRTERPSELDLVSAGAARRRPNRPH
jgi:hypothetical protein